MCCIMQGDSQRKVEKSGRKLGKKYDFPQENEEMFKAIILYEMLVLNTI